MGYLNKINSVNAVRRIVAAILISIVVNELVTTMLLRSFPGHSWVVETMLDGLLLFLSSFPIIFIFVYRPLKHFVKVVEEEKEKITLSESDLRQSDQMLKIVLENFPGVVFWKDRKLKYGGANQGFAGMFGHSRASDIAGKTDYDLMSDVQAADKFRAVDSEVMNSGIPKLNVLEQVKAVGGRVIWFDTNKIPLRDEEGNVIGVLGVSLDVTERLKEEEKLRETSQYLDKLFRNANAPIITWDPSLLITRFNDAFEELSGYQYGEVIGKNLDILFPDKHKEVSIDIIKKTGSGNNLKTVEIMIQRKDGELRSVIWNTANVLADDGVTIAATIAQGQDITDQKDAEEALREQNDLLVSLLKYSPVNIFIKEVSTKENRVLNVSDNFHELTGIPSAQMIGKTMHELFPSDFADKIVVDDWTIFTNGNVLNIEETLNGRIYNTIKFPFILGDKKIIGGFSIDITERKKAVTQIEEAVKKLELSKEELRQKNTELEQFTYTVSHDLKSPLITIKGYSGGLLRDLSNGRHDRFESDLKRIAVAADKMTSLLENLLELSRIGRIVNPPTKFSMGELTHDVISLLSGPITKCNANIVVQEGLPDIYADRTRMHEVIQNLVENALKFTGERPEPTIEIGLRKNGVSNQIFFIRDNGKGIDPRYHETVFGLFNKLDASTEGTGIGLALVRRIIEVHGGRIWVESEGINRGTTFCFTLQTNEQNGKEQ